MSQTNIAIVLCDTLRRDVLDVYGGPVSTRQLLEALGGRTVAYLGYSNSFWTIPSHFSLFTGLPVSKHGVHEAPGRNTVEAVMELGRQQYGGPTLAWELRKRGYETIGISANPIVSYLSGLDRGFRHFVPYDFSYLFRLLGGSLLDLAERQELWEANAKYRGNLPRAFISEARQRGLGWALSLTGAYIRKNVVQHLVSDYITDKGAAVAISILKSLHLAEPFFLFINLMEAHEPYYYRSKYDYRHLGCRRCLDREFRGYLRSARVCVRAVAEIARLLWERDLLRRTLFVFTSDHGQEFAEHGALVHLSGHLYRENVGIPIIVKPPDGLKLLATNCYVGLHELYGLALAAASGEREWLPSCGPGLAESYDGVAPDPEAGKGLRRVAVFKGDRKVAYRLDGGDPVVEEVVVAGRPLDPRSTEAERVAEELSGYLTAP